MPRVSEPAGRARAARAAGLPRYAHALRDFEAAEHAEGWLVRCAEAGRFLALNAELVAALHDVLAALGSGDVLEVCAGDGALAAALRGAGSSVIATDASPPAGADGNVIALTATEALRRFRPSVVLGSFVPVDAGVHEEILGNPDVQHYLVLGAALPGGGSGLLHTARGWDRERLPDVARWMISRHDFFVSRDRPIVTHGEAWLCQRQPGNPHI